MGKARYIYFEDEINNRLSKIPNMSSLINRLLKDYFAEEEFEGLTEEEIKLELKIIELEKQFKAKVEGLRNGKGRVIKKKA